MVRQARELQGRLTMRAAFTLACVFAFLLPADAALAQDITDVSDNIISSGSLLPGLISAVAYLLGLLLGVTGILKLKAHVENPGNGSGQTPLRTPIIRFIAGGAFFSLPIIYQSLRQTLDGGLDDPLFDPSSVATAISSLFGVASSIVPTLNVNDILANIIESLEGLPNLIAAFAYLLGLIIAINGILKIKEHVENPDSNPLREGIIRLLTAGALFALPTIYNAMFVSIDGPEDGGILSLISEIFGGLGFLYSGYAQSACNPVSSGVSGVLGGASTGGLICGILLHAGAFPAFLTGIAYLFGLVLGLWGILKIRDHVLNPQQVDIFQGVSRLLAGGAFFALPVIVEVFRNTVSNAALSANAAVPVAGYNDGGGGIIGGLISSLTGGSGACPDVVANDIGVDGMLVCFVNDIFGPMHVILNFFAFVAGMIFLMIGISRLIKSAQDGAKGPGGLGTMMTFIMGGALISYNEIMRAASTTFAGSPVTRTYATLQYKAGLGDAEVAAAHAVISAVIKFMIIVGLISFVRGLFIVRNVAEGAQQASMMSAVSHIVAGALAVNLGPLLGAIQNTLGIGKYGILFTL